jgi:hypothetical protein
VSKDTHCKYGHNALMLCACAPTTGERDEW